MWFWFYLLLKQDDIVPGKVHSKRDTFQAFQQRVYDKSQIAMEPKLTMQNLMFAESCDNDFLKFLELSQDLSSEEETFQII